MNFARASGAVSSETFGQRGNFWRNHTVTHILYSLNNHIVALCNQSHHLRLTFAFAMEPESSNDSVHSSVSKKLNSFKPVTTAPSVDISLNFISDLAPEVVNRWMRSRQITLIEKDGKIQPIHLLFGAVISAMLRATSLHEADEAYESYNSLLSLYNPSNNEHPIVLGFSSGTSTFDQTSIWYDLFQTAGRGDVLVPGTEALNFYKLAGAGASDEAEYSVADTSASDRRNKKLTQPPLKSLDETRSYNLSLVIHCFAKAVRNNQCGALIHNCLLRFKQFFNPLLEYRKALDIKPHTEIALHDFYDAWYQSAGHVEKTDYKTRLISTVISMCVTPNEVERVRIFLNRIHGLKLRLEVCKMCLVQRFGVSDDNPCTEQLSSYEIAKIYLSVKPGPSRPNAALPGLLSVLFSTWYALVTNDYKKTPTVSRVEERREEKRSNKTLTRLTHARQRSWQEEFLGAPLQDIAALKMSLSVLANHLLMDFRSSQ